MHYNRILLFCIVFLLFTSCKEKKPPVQTDYSLKLPHPSQTLTLLFCGDIIQHLPQIYSAHEPSEKDYKYQKCFKYIAPYWADADFVIANLETTLGNKDFSGYPRFCSPWQIARDLHQLGVTTFVTANNHSCDQLGKGITNTIYYLDSLGIPHTGTFTDTLNYKKRHPLYLQKDGFKIALLNYTYGTNGLPVPKGFVVPHIDTTAIKQDIQLAHRDTATNIIAFMHWGYEQGADMVIGSHPHVVQPIEYYTSNKDTLGVTVFSLGNFISNQSQQGTEGGICIRVTLTKPRNNPVRYQMEPIKFYMYRPYEEGRRRYYVVPENLADSIMKDFHLTKSKNFFKKTDTILKSTKTFSF